jgi:anaerobic magnesium-protoporphyrin IX monomethyl ester cyclase
MKKVLFIDPPHYYWPMISKDFDRFLMPLSYLCLTAMLLKHKAASPKILDCTVLKMGWKSLRERLARENPDMVCIGPKTTFAHEAGKAFALAKEINPSVVTVGGGYFYSALPEESLNSHPIDYIVRWEGEETLLELVRELDKPDPRPEKVSGICFKRNGHVVATPIRPLIKDLDSLPYPAYLDLPNHEDYAKPGRWPGTIVVQHSRGCPATCTFCSVWDQEGDHVLENGRLRPKPAYRTKSPERMVDEVEAFQRQYGNRHFVFLDGTWNVDPAWNEAFCEEVLQRGLTFTWYAFLRADYLLRDEEMGIFPKMVRAGLRNAFVGLERPTDEDLRKVRKGYGTDTALRVAALLKSKYPEVVSQGGLLIGLPHETRSSAQFLIEYALKLPMDFVSLYTVMPHPGTDVWREAKEKGRIEATDYAEYDWIYPVMGSETMTRHEIYHASLLYPKRLMKRPWWVLKGLVSRHSFKRSAYFYFVKNALKVLWLSTTSRGPKPWGMKKPRWYDR